MIIARMSYFHGSDEYVLYGRDWYMNFELLWFEKVAELKFFKLRRSVLIPFGPIMSYRVL